MNFHPVVRSFLRQPEIQLAAADHPDSAMVPFEAVYDLRSTSNPHPVGAVEHQVVDGNW
ncbi:MAG: hypothetical protein ACOX87_06360 [Chloroflexota bacterium]